MLGLHQHLKVLEPSQAEPSPVTPADVITLIMDGMSLVPNDVTTAGGWGRVGLIEREAEAGWGWVGFECGWVKATHVARGTNGW